MTTAGEVRGGLGAHPAVLAFELLLLFLLDGLSARY
jgi:hypothetical protein